MRMAKQQQKLKGFQKLLYEPDSFLSHFPYFFAVLQGDGHQLILEKIPDWRAVELVVDEGIVFHCNINDLDFGDDCKSDPLYEEARKAVLNA